MIFALNMVKKGTFQNTTKINIIQINLTKNNSKGIEVGLQEIRKGKNRGDKNLVVLDREYTFLSVRSVDNGCH